MYVVAKHADLKPVFIRANLVRLQKVEQDFLCSNVGNVAEVGFEAWRNYRGFTRQQFLSKFGYSPEQLGYKYTSMPNEMGINLMRY